MSETVLTIHLHEAQSLCAGFMPVSAAQFSGYYYGVFNFFFGTKDSKEMRFLELKAPYYPKDL